MSKEAVDTRVDLREIKLRAKCRVCSSDLWLELAVQEGRALFTGRCMAPYLEHDINACVPCNTVNSLVVRRIDGGYLKCS